MPSLIEGLTTQLDTGQIAYGEQQISVVDCIAQARAIRLRYPQLAGAKIQLNYTNLVDFITGLIAFDGWCEAIYLCPPDVLLEHLDNLQSWPLSEQVSVNNQVNTAIKTVTCKVIATYWYLATSGTTGQPKWFAHSFQSLTASIKQSTNLQQLSWGLMYQPFRFAGLQVVLQALLSGADLVDVTGSEPLAQLTLMQINKVSAVSATPSLWRQLLMTQQLNQLALRHITLGGEIVDQTLLDQLYRLFPQAKIRHIYASTEAGVGFVVSDGKAGFPLSWLNNSQLPITLKISNEQHLLVKPSKPINPSSNITLDELGFMDTQDRVEVLADRVLFLGRATGVINVGGNKVYPEKVEQVLLSAADVCQARVYAKKNPLMGQLVVADIVLLPHADKTQVKQQALILCKKLLQRFEIPTKITIVESIAHNPSGKLNRKLN